MKQGRKLILACVALALLCVAAPTIVAAAPRAAKAATSVKRQAGLRQFSGWVTAVDKSSLTVEKRGRNPRSLVFERDAGMSTTGELEKDARVTVYYRDEDGHTIAHRVVVKQGAGKAPRS